MPVIQVTIKDEHALAKLKAFMGSGENIVLPGLMDDIGAYLTKYAANQGMASQGGVYDANWPRLNQKYALWKAKKWPGRPIMERTGHLKDSWAYSATDSHVDIGNNADYWVYHQNGGQHVPKRLLIGVNDTNKRQVGRLIGDALERKFRAA